MQPYDDYSSNFKSEVLVMKKFLKVSSLLLVVALLFSFAACGEKTPADGEGENETNDAVKVIDINLTEEEYAFGVDKAQPELLEDVNAFIEKIMNDGTFDNVCNNYFGDGTPVAVKSAAFDETKDQLVVATNAAFEPFEYMKGDSYYGIDMEIAALLAEELGKELVISNMEFDAVCLTVGQHKADIAMAGLTVKPDREEHVTFSTSYYQASQKLIVTADNTTFDACETKEDVEAILNGLTAEDKVGVQNGTTGNFYVKGDDADYAGLPATCVGYKNGALAVQDLINGNIGYVIIDAAPADAIVAQMNKVA